MKSKIEYRNLYNSVIFIELIYAKKHITFMKFLVVCDIHGNIKTLNKLVPAMQATSYISALKDGVLRGL